MILRLAKFLQDKVSAVLEKNNQRLLEKMNNSKIAQTQLFLQYQNLKNEGKQLPAFTDTGFRVYSQNDEDGLLLYIFALIGFTDRRCVDIAFGSPNGANVTNLICNWNFSGLLIEGNDTQASRDFFEKHPDSWIYPPKLVKAWVTRENVNGILKKNGITGDIDLFSLDLDGVDYWIWKEIQAIKPRVIILEYMNIFGPHDSVTVPYKPDFNRFDVHEDFFGASLWAYVKLGRKKGYRLIGCNKYGFNAFFLRNDVGENVFPEVTVSSCLTHPSAMDGQKTRLPRVKKLGWVRV